MLKNYGFNPDTVEITEEDWKLGSNIPLTVLKKDGQYDEFLPQYEPQVEKYETWGCTCWGLQNQKEIFMKVVFGFEPNFSERYLYNIAEIGEGGASPTKAYEAARKNGEINQALLPVPDTYKEFCTPRPIQQYYLDEGKKWLGKYTFNHEWVRPAVPSKMKELIKATLPYGPIALSVSAWIEKDGLYIDGGMANNHWCVCYGYIEDERGLILKIFDSYDHSTKLLHPDHMVSFAKRISITERKEPSLSFWQKLFNFL